MSLKRQVEAIVREGRRRRLLSGMDLDPVLAQDSFFRRYLKGAVQDLNRWGVEVAYGPLEEDTPLADPEGASVELSYGSARDSLMEYFETIRDIKRMNKEQEVRLTKRLEFARHLLMQVFEKVVPAAERRAMRVRGRSSLAPAVDQILQRAAEIEIRGGRGSKKLQARRRELFKKRAVEFSELRDELIRRNLYLVVRIARHFRGYGMSLPDLIQEGNVGLLRATDKFDWRRNCRFSTYATWWIKDGIKRALSNNLRTVRIPIYLQQRIRTLMRQGGFTPEQELRGGAESGITPTELRRVLKLNSGGLSLDQSLDPDDDYVLRDALEDDKIQSPADVVEADSLKQRIELVLGELSDRERQVIKLRFGIGCERPHTLEEIGALFSVSRERIRQLQASAISKLRVPERSRELTGFL